MSSRVSNRKTRRSSSWNWLGDHKAIVFVIRWKKKVSKRKRFVGHTCLTNFIHQKLWTEELYNMNFITQVD